MNCTIKTELEAYRKLEPIVKRRMVEKDKRIVILERALEIIDCNCYRYKRINRYKAIEMAEEEYSNKDL